MNLSNYARNKIYDHMTGRASWTMPTTVYASLHITSPHPSGGGTEVTGTGYVRKAVTFAAASNGVGQNSNLVDWGTAGGVWGTVVYVGLWDAVSGGNLLASNAMAEPVTIVNGTPFSIAIGDIDLTVE